MKTIASAALCFVLASFWSSAALAVKVGDVLPKITVKDASGKDIEPWAGHVTLINFWATWCDACKVELKEMAGEVSKISSREKVAFISLDKDSGKAKEWMAKEFKSAGVMSENLFHDNSFKLADALGIESFPMTLVVDASGKVLKIQDGFKEGSGSTEALFEALRKNAAK
jgi:thiol-disulfide isomerase/thioredoxin